MQALGTTNLYGDGFTTNQLRFGADVLVAGAVILSAGVFAVGMYKFVTKPNISETRSLIYGGITVLSAAGAFLGTYWLSEKVNNTAKNMDGLIFNKDKRTVPLNRATTPLSGAATPLSGAATPHSSGYLQTLPGKGFSKP